MNIKAYILAVISTLALFALFRTFSTETPLWFALPALFVSGGLYLVYAAE